LGSLIYIEDREILAQTSHDKEEILIAEVDLDLQENVRPTVFLEIGELMPLVTLRK
jgi:predicted amidohydrolase